METTNSQPLSIESFSYSWLVNIKSSLESRGTSFRISLDAASDEANSFIEMDPTMPPSKRFSVNYQDFMFESFPVSPSSLTFVHADQLISNGYLMPFFIDPLKKVQPYDAKELTSSSISNSNTSPIVKITDPIGKSECSSFRKSCRRLSRRFLKKYLNFMRPFCRRIQGVGTSAKAEKIYGGSQSVKNWVYSSETLPRLSVAQSCDEWRRSCDSETSIYEAVLHCKRSIGNEN